MRCGNAISITVRYRTFAYFPKMFTQDIGKRAIPSFVRATARRTFFFFALLTMAVLSACGGGGGSPSPTPPATGQSDALTWDSGTWDNTNWS
jgi:hypothetical protein